MIEFVGPDSDAAKDIEKKHQLIKEVERPKYLRKNIMAMMKAEGFGQFSTYAHTQLWKSMDAKNEAKGLVKKLATRGIGMTSGSRQ